MSRQETSQSLAKGLGFRVLGFMGLGFKMLLNPKRVPFLSRIQIEDFGFRPQGPAGRRV